MFRNDQQLSMWKEAVVTFEVVGRAVLELNRTEREKPENISERTACKKFKFGTSRIQHFSIIAALTS
jgi:hypothetical protein